MSSPRRTAGSRVNPSSTGKETASEDDAEPLTFLSGAHGSRLRSPGPGMLARAYTRTTLFPLSARRSLSLWLGGLRKYMEACRKMVASVTEWGPQRAHRPGEAGQCHPRP